VTIGLRRRDQKPACERYRGDMSKLHARFIDRHKATVKTRCADAGHALRCEIRKRVAQRKVGDLQQPAEGMVEFENQEDRA